MRRAGGRRSVVAVVVLALLAATTPAPSRAAEDGFSENGRNFIDKWVINGNAIGNAVGAVGGQLLFGLMFPGPIGMVVGSVLGALVGGYIGAAFDDRMGIAVNYVSFDRPPLTKGGLWLANVGPWEQFLYQVDSWVVNGGSLAAMASHFSLNFAARAIPGFGIFASPVLLALANYVAATVADNMDGLTDLGKLGRKIDEHKGLVPEVGTDNEADGQSDDVTRNDPLTVREAYDELVYQLRHGSRDSMEQALDGYRNVKESLKDLFAKRKDAGL